MTDRNDHGARALVINGTVGVGKTTTADLVGDRWREAGIPGAVIDVDGLRRAWPAPPDDPFHATLGLTNLAAVVANHVRAGALRLVLADVLEDRSQRDRQQRAIGLPTTVVRLRADPDRIVPRLAARHRDDHDGGAGLAWHLARVTELQAILDAADVDDAVVDVTEFDALAVVDRVLAVTGWPESTPES
ncbi:hypothetical protein FHX74_002796 [Friedmanniella endophytica]|uniref:AAA domain-containing protein n=1 Tax=Microlunatus kandeliicorticis TaxID=1759536 RepID=A0A7W3ITZ2_9ACTN|nr:hypothetical protein [Microlunatus kandeliicorticis]MBA8795168.1 hypothetical protein [Microlunatus kandeliicorticis]